MNWFQRRPDRVIDTLIKPPVQKFSGQDDALRQRTEAKRARAAEIRQEAVQIETETEKPRRLHLSGGRR